MTNLKEILSNLFSNRLVNIDFKQLLRNIFDWIRPFIWEYRWLLAILIGISLISFILEQLLKIKIFRIVFTIIVFAAVIWFFIWLYK